MPRGIVGARCGWPVSWLPGRRPNGPCTNASPFPARGQWDCQKRRSLLRLQWRGPRRYHTGLPEHHRR
ncbi:hypothetical protein DVS28_a2361 [Euzebya pacifica]|uniref:Uncharacterized protein n=1 Tax=Euzebya pacifica TaxID=1608957 RepID=A0A346XXU5_9ACTN|nr:hypothetical protein DVS28_a2361 [Euzebya pacifica]